MDQIRVLVSQRTPNMLCHSRIRENANVSRYENTCFFIYLLLIAAAARLGSARHSYMYYTVIRWMFREEWDWIQSLSAAADQGEEAEPRAESHTPLLYYELQTSIRSLLKLLNLPLSQVRADKAENIRLCHYAS